MKVWRVFGFVEGLENLFVEAESFDGALVTARKINPNYSGAQLWSAE